MNCQLNYNNQSKLNSKFNNICMQVLLGLVRIKIINKSSMWAPDPHEHVPHIGQIAPGRSLL